MKCKIHSLFLMMTPLFMVSCVEQADRVSSSKVVKSAIVREHNEQSCEVSYPARVSAAVDVNLSFRVAGVIDGFAVSEGERVRKGDVIVYMDRRDYELQLAATEAEYDGVRSEAERVIALYGEQSVSENDYDKAVNGLRRITAKLESHRNALSDATLVAPFDGYLSKRYFDRGEAVAAGMPVAQFVSSSSPELVVNITSNDYIRREAFASATASFNIFPDMSFPLRLISFAPTANLNQLYAARFAVESVEGVTPPAGISAVASLLFDVEPSSSFEVPLSGVVEREGRSYLWIVEEGVIALREVEMESILAGGVAVVKGDINDGDVVVSAGVNRLHEGERVRVSNIDNTL